MKRETFDGVRKTRRLWVKIIVYKQRHDNLLHKTRGVRPAGFIDKTLGIYSHRNIVGLRICEHETLPKRSGRSAEMSKMECIMIYNNDVISFYE